jgi:hypothetical protein
LCRCLSLGHHGSRSVVCCPLLTERYCGRIYTTCLSLGSSIGPVIAGLCTINGSSYRIDYWICLGVSGATALLMFFTLPETAYVRDPNTAAAIKVTADGVSQDVEDKADDVAIEDVRPAWIGAIPTPARAPAIRQVMRTWPTKIFTGEPLWKLILRPIGLIILPSALWASLVLAVGIGFLVASEFNFVFFPPFSLGSSLTSILFVLEMSQMAKNLVSP